MSLQGGSRDCVVIYKGHWIDQFSRTSSSSRRERKEIFSPGAFIRRFAAPFILSVITQCRGEEKKSRQSQWGIRSWADHAKLPSRTNWSVVVSVKNRLLRTGQTGFDFPPNPFRDIHSLRNWILRFRRRIIASALAFTRVNRLFQRKILLPNKNHAKQDKRNRLNTTKINLI